MTNEQITELADGLTVVSEPLDHVRSAAIGFFVDVGSVDEDTEQAGYSHLLEHMLFRGTASFSSEEIDQRFDAMGAEVNAGTGKENTSVFSRMLDTHIDEAFEMLAEMVWQPSLADEALTQERQIVLEELAMYDDDPQDRVFDLAARSVFGDQPLGRPVLGTAEVVSAARTGALTDYHARHYRQGRIVIAAAGSVDHDQLVEMARRQRERALGGQPHQPLEKRRAVQPVTAGPRIELATKPTEQAHFVASGPGLARDDERRFALRILDGLLGGTSSSRLFQELRERRGLAYAVYSFSSFFAQTGQVGIYFGTRPDRLQEATDALAAELDRLCSEPVGQDELDRARENVKGRTILAMEAPGGRMNRLGASLLAGLPLLTMEEVIERLDAVTVADLLDLSQRLFSREVLSVAAIAPDARPVLAAASTLNERIPV